MKFCELIRVLQKEEKILIKELINADKNIFILYLKIMRDNFGCFETIYLKYLLS